MASEEKTQIPDWIRRLAVMSGKSPETLASLAASSPKEFSQIAATHGFQPPKSGAKQKKEADWKGKYRLPSIGEMISRFGEVKPETKKGEKKGSPPTRGTFMTTPFLQWMLKGDKEYYDKFRKAKGAEAPVVEAKAAEAAPSVNPNDTAPRTVAELGDLRPAVPSYGRTGTPPKAMSAAMPASTPASMSMPAVSQLYPPAPAMAAARNALEASAPPSTSDASSSAALIGAALSGVKAPAPPNVLPGAGIPSHGAVPQTSVSDILNMLGISVGRKSGRTLGEATR